MTKEITPAVKPALYMPEAEEAIPPSPSTTIDIFDEDDFISRSLGDIDLSRAVATVFIDNGPVYIEAVRRALTAQDNGALRQSAHKLKGAAATISLARLAETAHLLEKMAEIGDQKNATALLAEVVKQFELAIKALQEFIRTSPEISPL